MIRFIFLAVLMTLVWPVQATTVVISERNCRDLIEHKPAKGVTYEPGVDVTGKAVVPADLGGGYQLDLPRLYRINLTVQPFDLTGPEEDQDPKLEESGLYLGEISINESGQAFYNGKAIQTAAQEELTLFCQVIEDRD